jgi:hypothetical protein
MPESFISCGVPGFPFVVSWHDDDQEDKLAINLYSTLRRGEAPRSLYCCGPIGQVQTKPHGIPGAGTGIPPLHVQTHLFRSQTLIIFPQNCKQGSGVGHDQVLFGEVHWQLSAANLTAFRSGAGPPIAIVR